MRVEISKNRGATWEVANITSKAPVSYKNTQTSELN